VARRESVPRRRSNDRRVARVADALSTCRAVRRTTELGQRRAVVMNSTIFRWRRVWIGHPSARPQPVASSSAPGLLTLDGTDADLCQRLSRPSSAARQQHHECPGVGATRPNRHWLSRPDSPCAGTSRTTRSAVVDDRVNRPGRASARFTHSSWPFACGHRVPVVLSSQRRQCTHLPELFASFLG